LRAIHRKREIAIRACLGAGRGRLVRQLLTEFILAFVALITAVLFGLFPALQISRADLNAALKEGGRRTGSGFGQNKARTLLAIGEIAIAVVLVIGAALLIRTSLAPQTVKPGFDAHNVLTMRMSLAGQRFQTSATIEQLIKTGTERLRAIPGVLTASATCCIPLEGGYGLPFQVLGRPLTNGPFHGGGA